MNQMTFVTSYILGRMRRLYFMAIPETKQDFKKSRICYSVGDTSAQIIAQLSGGTFIAALLSSVGISDSNIGIITSLTCLAAIFQLFAMKFTKRLKKSKLFVCVTVLQRILLSAMFFVPFFPWSKTVQIVVIIICYTIAQICVQIGTPATQDWLASLVPARLRGKYLAIKDSRAVFFVSATLLLVGIMMDSLKTNALLQAFFILGVIIFVLVIINVISFSCMKEPRFSYINEEGKEMHGNLAKKAKHQEVLVEDSNFYQDFCDAFRSSRFRKALFLNCFYLTSFYFASPFNSNYQIKELQLPYTFLMLIGFVVTLVRIAITPKMGKLGDRYGMARVLKYAMLFLGISYLIMGLTTKENAYVLFVISSIFSAIAWSFIGIGTFGVQLELVDREKRITQLSILLSISGVYGFAVTWFAGRFLDFLQRRDIILFGKPVYGQQILNFIAFFIMIFVFLYAKFCVQREKVQSNHADGIIK